MDNYEVNVLTRKGGWKKLPQEVLDNNLSKDTTLSKDSKPSNNSDDLIINVTDEAFESENSVNKNNNLFENFTEINDIINKLKNVENQKNTLINELNVIMKNFENRKANLDKKLINIQKEKDMYEKAINLILSLKNA